MGKIITNDYQYVDLGLPSGTLWATCNVGANKPTDIGFYFAWGDVIGHMFGNDGHPFLQETHKHWVGGIYSKYDTSIDGLATLEKEDDAAHSHMGGDWRMPYGYELQELVSHTYQSACQEGIKFTSHHNKDNAILFPFSGFISGKALEHTDFAMIWSINIGKMNVRNPSYMIANGNGCNLVSVCDRHFGFNVRGVINNKK